MGTPKLCTCFWVSLQRLMALQQRKVGELHKDRCHYGHLPWVEGRGYQEKQRAGELGLFSLGSDG